MAHFDLNLFLTCLLLLSVLYLVLGYRAAAPVSNHEDYLLSGRSLGTWALTMTIVATQLGGGTLLGSAQEAYRSGWSVIFYPMGSCLGLLVLASGFGARMRSYGFTTVSELFETIYGSRRLRQFSSLLSILSLLIILVAQGIAARKFLHSLGLESPLFFLACWSVLILYTVAGGLTAVVNTDIVQALFIIAAFAAATFFDLGLAKLQFDPAALSPHQLLSGQTPWSSWLLMPFCFMLIEQDMGQRLFAAKDRRAIRLACFSACCIMLATTALPIFLGILAHQLQLPVPPDSSVLLTVIGQLSSPAFSAIFACAILMAILSTADSLLCSITSNLTFDFPLPERIDAQVKLRAAKAVTFFVGLISIVLSFLFDDLLAVLIFSYELSVAILFVPVVAGFLNPRRPRAAALASCVISSLVYLICTGLSCLQQLLPGPLPTLAHTITSQSVWLAIGSGFAAFTTVCYLKKRQEPCV